MTLDTDLSGAALKLMVTVVTVDIPVVVGSVLKLQRPTVPSKRTTNRLAGSWQSNVSVVRA